MKQQVVCQSKNLVPNQQNQQKDAVFINVVFQAVPVAGVPSMGNTFTVTEAQADTFKLGGTYTISIDPAV